MQIQLAKSLLRPWQQGDEAALVRYANNRNIWRNLRDRFPHPYTKKDAQEWIATASQQQPQTTFAIVVDGMAVGGIGIELQNDVYRRSAEIGYWLGEEFWGRGIVTEAVQAITDWAFANFDLCRIYAGVFEWNLASMRVLEKTGFQFEARSRKQITKDSQTIDQMLYVIVR